MSSKIIFTILCYISLCSCKKFLEIPPPKTDAQSSLLFNDDAAAIAATVGAYSEITRTNLNIMSGGLTLYPALTADELYNTSPNADLDPFTSNSILPITTTGLTRLWQQGYKNIYHANAVLEGLEGSKKLTDSIKTRLKGEMLFLRALNTFYLVNLFGDVPLQLTTDYRLNGTMARTAASKVYEQLIKDLQESKSLLPAAYTASNRTRPNKWTASALLARVYLYQQQWAAAEAEATGTLQSGMYSLVSNLNNVFLPSSSETIWQLARDNSNTAEGATFIPSSSSVKPAYALTTQLLNAFETDDNRKSAWTNKNTVSNLAYYYPYKYKIRSGTPVAEFYVVFRLAEIFLIRSEARAQQDKLTEGNTDLNIIRQRAGLPALNLTDKDILLQAIEHERQVELFTEWGHRWFDLIRTNGANTVLGTVKGTNWQPTDQLYPIPQFDIDANPFLTQNPGY